MTEKKTWRFNGQEIAAAVAGTSSLRQAAKRLGCNVSTVSRAVQAGRAPARLGRQPRADTAEPPPESPQTPAQWAALVRAVYQFSASEDMIVSLAVEALTIAGDKDERASDRLAAARTFAGLLKGLDLPVEATNGETQTPTYPRRVG